MFLPDMDHLHLHLIWFFNPRNAADAPRFNTPRLFIIVQSYVQKQAYKAT